MESETETIKSFEELFDEQGWGATSTHKDTNTNGTLQVDWCVWLRGREEEKKVLVDARFSSQYVSICVIDSRANPSEKPDAESFHGEDSLDQALEFTKNQVEGLLAD